MTPKRRITDPETLKGLAHPLRRQLYRLLTQTGPATVSQLAVRMPLDPGHVSYHLRQLARWGYIEEAPELARDRRERWWRVPSGSVSWSFLDFRDPESRAIAETVKTQMIGDEFERLRGFESKRDSWSEDWQDAAISGEAFLRLNPEDMAGLTRDLLEVLDRWKEKGQASADPEGGREPVFMFFHAFPERP